MAVSSKQQAVIGNLFRVAPLPLKAYSLQPRTQRPLPLNDGGSAGQRLRFPSPDSRLLFLPPSLTVSHRLLSLANRLTALAPTVFSALPTR